MKNFYATLFSVFVTMGFVFAGLGTSVLPGFAEESSRSDVESTRAASVLRGVEYLRVAQLPDGGFSTQLGIGPTTVVLLGLLANGFGPDDPMVAPSLDFVLAAAQPDGSIRSPDARTANYETCLAVACLIRARDLTGSTAWDEKIAAAEHFLRSGQFTEANGTSLADPYYGGMGYGGSKRPDLSNVAFFIETLHTLGATGDDPALTAALVFVSRCQNFDTSEPGSLSATNLSRVNFPAEPDGGFIYTCAGDGESFAGELPEGGLRSYGSMTYAGFKSMIYAGLAADDPRVKAAEKWLANHYSVTENPGLGDRGLYYYYMTMGKALEALGTKTFIDDTGTVHDWRKDLVFQLAASQQPDGSWVNTNRAWLETDPNLVSGYALIALAACAPFTVSH